MKILQLGVLVLLSLWLGGCQPDQEDRDFFYSGWVHPEQGANRRMYGSDHPPEEMRQGLRSPDLSAE